MAYLQVVCRRRRYLRGSNIGNSKKKRKKKQLKQKERNFFDCFFLFVVVVVLSISHLFFYGLNPVFFIIELYRVVLDFLGFEIKIV